MGFRTVYDGVCPRCSAPLEIVDLDDAPAAIPSHSLCPHCREGVCLPECGALADAYWYDYGDHGWLEP